MFSTPNVLRMSFLYFCFMLTIMRWPASDWRATSRDILSLLRWMTFIRMGGCETIRSPPAARMHLRSHYSITIN